jgi:hypothetical protein
MTVLYYFLWNFFYFYPHTDKNGLYYYFFFPTFLFILDFFLESTSYRLVNTTNSVTERVTDLYKRQSACLSLFFLVSLLFNSCGGTGGMSPLYFFFSVVGVLICRPFEREKIKEGRTNRFFIEEKRFERVK